MVLAAVVGPGWWAILQPSSPAADVIDDPDARIRVALTVAVAVPAVIVGTAALMRRDARSLGLIVFSAIVFSELAFAVLWLIAFGGALVGLDVALATAAAVLVGVLLAKALAPKRRASS